VKEKCVVDSERYSQKFAQPNIANSLEKTGVYGEHSEGELVGNQGTGFF